MAVKGARKASQARRPVIVCTEHRGVFYGFVEGDTLKADPIVLADARMAIYWGTNKGVFQLAQSGPTGSSKISATVPSIELRKITAVIEVTPEAAKAWEAVK